MRREPSIPPLRALTISVVCFVLFLICVALILSGCASTRLGKVGDVAVIGAGIADYTSTRSAINNGGREANPLMGQDALRQALVKGFGISAVLAGSLWAERKDKTVTAWIIRATAIGVWSVISVRNYQIARQ